MDLILLFFLRCGLASRLSKAVMRPIFSEIDDTDDSISFVIVKGGLYASIKGTSIFLRIILRIFFLDYTEGTEKIQCPSIRFPSPFHHMQIPQFPIPNPLHHLIGMGLQVIPVPIRNPLAAQLSNDSGADRFDGL